MPALTTSASPLRVHVRELAGLSHRWEQQGWDLRSAAWGIQRAGLDVPPELWSPVHEFLESWASELALSAAAATALSDGLAGMASEFAATDSTIAGKVGDAPREPR